MYVYTIVVPLRTAKRLRVLESVHESVCARVRLRLEQCTQLAQILCLFSFYLSRFLAVSYLSLRPPKHHSHAHARARARAHTHGFDGCVYV
jgi:hypothetical protein